MDAKHSGARALAVVLLLTVAGCGDEPAPSAPPSEETTMSQYDERVEAAVQDLASRESLDPAEVEVVDARDVTWPDGSLGCPKPGMSYLQALTDGYLLVLEAGGKRYEYHGAREGELRYCEDPRPPAAGSR